MYLITEHENENKVGNVVFTDKKRAWPEKNKSGDIQVHRDGDFETVGEQVCLGFHDFEGEPEFNDPNVVQSAIEQKFQSIDDEFLVAAGKDPSEY
jgi:hypothetical protein